MSDGWDRWNRFLSEARACALSLDVDSRAFGQAVVGGAGGSDHGARVVMTRQWSVWRDAVWWSALVLYAVNHWVVCPHVEGAFLHGHLNDLLLIPVALPPVLQIQSCLAWRPMGWPPQPNESVFHLAVWSLVCEGIGPQWLGRGTADAWDVACYAVGAVLAQWWWSRPSGFDLQGAARADPS